MSETPTNYIILKVIGLLLLLISIFRFGLAIKRGWTTHKGELLANFPMYPVLKFYNSDLYASIPHAEVWLGDKSWFYGPFHHLVHFPLTLVAPSVEFFFRFMLLFYVVALLVVLFCFTQFGCGKPNYCLTTFVFALTLGQFAVLDNLQQRNIELMEFILLIAAFLSLTFRRERLSGSLLCLAGSAKLLPFVFLPFLVIKRRYKSIIAYAVTFLLIVVLTEISLGWKNYSMFQPGVATGVGIPSIDALLGKTPIRTLNHLNGSFYTFILALFADIDLRSYVPRGELRITNFLLINWTFLAIAILMALSSFFVIWKNRNDLLCDFSILSSLMLAAFPHCNPHYYVFTLFGSYVMLRALLSDRPSPYGPSYKYLLGAVFMVITLMLGGVIPFSIYDKLFRLESPYIHVMAIYGIQGLAAFFLWCAVMFIAIWEKHGVSRAGEPPSSPAQGFVARSH